MPGPELDLVGEEEFAGVADAIRGGRGCPFDCSCTHEEPVRYEVVT